MAAKRRKPGEWKAIAASRARVLKEMVTHHGVSGAPSLSDVGSAAYRRLQVNTNKRGR